MHDASLPRSDRIEPPAARPREDPAYQKPAFVVRLEDGRFFKYWRRRGGLVAVHNLKRARIFSIEANETERTIAKLRRKGFLADIVEVKIIVTT
jgi:hypothetical protein